MNNKAVLAGLPLKELAELLPYPAFRAAQIYKWICSGAGSFEEMSNLPLAMRKELAEKYGLFAAGLKSVLSDPDGTEKLGIGFFTQQMYLRFALCP